MRLCDFFTLVDTKNEILHFKLSGFWTKAVVDEIGFELVRTFKQEIDSYTGKPFFAIADLIEFNMPSDKAKEYIKQVMDYGFVNHLTIAVEVAPKVLVKMGIQEAASKSKADKRRIQATSVEEAYEIIQKCKSQFVKSSR